MEKYICAFLFILINSLTLTAQKETAIWYFGDNAGVDFNNGSPVALTDGQIKTREGCTTISNSYGDLLFYTDGICVWDRNHDIMPNGIGLLGNSSSTQSAIIVPKPKDPNIYYIFTVSEKASSNGIRYSEVDLTLNGGNGDINNIKNIPLATPTAEKISAIKHSNGVDFWIVTHEWRTNNFLSFKITELGVDTNPVISSVGSIYEGGSAAAIGYMKISPNGKRLALARWTGDSYVEIFDFENSTGGVTNPILIENLFFKRSLGGAYGVEFSPNSKILYVSDLNGNSNSNSKVHQFDIAFQNATEITNSDFLLYDGSDFIAGIQLALDGKLYLANESSGFLDVIENPNQKGVGANYLGREIFLEGRNARMGLPPFIQSFFVDFQIENTCFGDTSMFSLETSSSVESVLWDFGDGDTSTITNPEYIYDSPGIYNVTVTITIGAEERILEREITIYDKPLNIDLSDFILCDDDAQDGFTIFNLDIKTQEALYNQSNTVFKVSFHKSKTEAEANKNNLPLFYTNEVENQVIFTRISNKENSACYVISSFRLAVNKNPNVQNNQSFTFCDDEIADGLVNLDLSEMDDRLFEYNNIQGFEVSYYLSEENANTKLESVANNYSTTSNPQILYARAENKDNSSCFKVTKIQINVVEPVIANQPNNYYLCDDVTNDGIAEFDLTTLNVQIVNGQSGNLSINYFLSEENALLNINPINPIFINSKLTEKLYARIENIDNLNCFDVTSLEIGIISPPEIVQKETYYLCPESSILISVEPNFDKYLWSTGETKSSISITKEGSYFVDIFQKSHTNPIVICSSRKEITVIKSGIAEISNIKIKDWSTKNNSIIVFASGIGNYEYSLDGTNYQSDNSFLNLTSGEYTVWVRDINGCGVVNKKIYLLNFPNFFTPNGDGANEYWKIENSYVEPNMEIYIYDRYSKLLSKIHPSDIGWDGTFNGKPQPASDYWFKVIRPNIGEVFNGHFSLKR